MHGDGRRRREARREAPRSLFNFSPMIVLHPQKLQGGGGDCDDGRFNNILNPCRVWVDQIELLIVLQSNVIPFFFL